MKSSNVKKNKNTNITIPKPERINALPGFGLTQAQAETRIAAGLDNKAVDAATKTVPQIIVSNVFTYFNLIFFILAAALFTVGSYKDTMFLLIVLINTLIGTVQELYAK